MVARLVQLQRGRRNLKSMRTIIAIILIALHLCDLPAKAAEDGIYLLKKGPPGSSILLPGGAAALVHQKLANNEYQLSLHSLSNWSDEYSIRLLSASVSTQSFDVVICLDDIFYTPVGLINERLKMLNESATVIKIDDRVASKIAKIKGCRVLNRQHPGHQIIMRMTSKVGRDLSGVFTHVQVLVELKNIGSNEIIVAVELDKKYTEDLRSGNLSLYPHEDCVRKCIDVRESSPIGTFTRLIRIKPDEKITVAKENLLKWYRPTNAGIYSFEGCYRLMIYRDLSDREPIWEERIANDFVVDFEM